MPLGYNKRYNSRNGLPVNGSDLTPANPARGTIARYGTRPCFVETAPKTGAGLPTGGDAEQYIVDFGPGVYRVRAFGNGAALAAGSTLGFLITAEGSAYTGNGEVGVLTNDDAGSGSMTDDITILALGDPDPIILEVVDGSGVANGSVGDVDVILF